MPPSFVPDSLTSMPQIKNGGAFGFGFGRPSFAKKKT
jgi:hypothetical protein